MFIKLSNYNETLFHVEYLSVILYFVIALLLSLVILTFSYLLVIQKPETEKLSTYECGFEPYEDARNRYDIKFYLVAILFIIFDIETMFLIPWTVSVSKLNLLGFWSMFDFIIELGLSYVYIWYSGALDWE